MSLQVQATATVEPQASTSAAAAAQPVKSGTQFLRTHMLKLAPYTPIEPFEILSARYGRKPEDIIKLDANENPYGPPPEVREALGNMAFPHIYPDPESRILRAALAKMQNIPIEHLLVSGWVGGEGGCRRGYTFRCNACMLYMARAHVTCGFALHS